MPEVTEQAGGILQAIETSAIATIVREEIWVYPILETLHVIGLGLVFGSIFAFDLRVLGWHPDLSVRRMHAHLLPWVWTGFLFNAMSGILLFTAEAQKFAVNPAFQVKLALIALAGLNALAFQTQVFPRVATWDTDAESPRRAKASAALSIAMWVGIITAGRMMAYVK